MLIDSQIISCFDFAYNSSAYCKVCITAHMTEREIESTFFKHLSICIFLKVQKSTILISICEL